MRKYAGKQGSFTRPVWVLGIPFTVIGAGVVVAVCGGHATRTAVRRPPSELVQRITPPSDARFPGETPQASRIVIERPAAPAEAQVDETAAPQTRPPDVHAVWPERRGELEQRVSGEAPDSLWGRDVETAFANGATTLAEQDPSLRGIRVESVACGQSVCRTRVIHPREDGFMDLYRVARTETALQGGGHFSREALPDGMFRTELYFARPGEELRYATE